MKETAAVEAVTLADRPDLFDAAFGIEYAEGDGSAFMQGNMFAILTRSRRLAERWAEHVLVLLDGDRVVARAVSVPFSTTRDNRSAFPDGGWDQVAIWSAEDAMDGISGDTICALEIAVDPTMRNRGLSVATLHALKANVARLGFSRLVAPARPPGKSAYPFEPIDTYVLRRRPDGELEDWWLRVHERAGGQVTSIARCSGTVQADLPTWRRWTGLPFDTSGEVAVPGGLVPVMVSVPHNIGVYVEPNIWFNYPL